jgi:hypothetical protein
VAKQPELASASSSVLSNQSMLLAEKIEFLWGCTGCDQFQVY